MILTAEQAIARLKDGDTVHTFVNPAGGMLLGADWTRAEAVKYLNASKEIMTTGPGAAATGHGIAATDAEGIRLVFFDTGPLTPEQRAIMDAEVARKD